MIFKKDPKDRLKLPKCPASTTHSGKSFHSLTILTKKMLQLQLDPLNCFLFFFKLIRRSLGKRDYLKKRQTCSTRLEKNTVFVCPMVTILEWCNVPRTACRPFSGWGWVSRPSFELSPVKRYPGLGKGTTLEQHTPGSALLEIYITRNI